MQEGDRSRARSRSRCRFEVRCQTGDDSDLWMWSHLSIVEGEIVVVFRWTTVRSLGIFEGFEAPELAGG